MKPLRGALVGFGRVAEDAHVPGYRQRPEFSIQAVVEAEAGRRKAAAALLPQARLYGSLADLLASEKGGLDFVDLATPPWLHAEQARACLQSGLHVLCEKPLALSEAEAAGLGAEAEAAGRALVCVHNWKAAPLFVRLKELLDDGRVGRLRYAEWHVLRTKPAADAGGGWRTDPKRSGGGIVMDHGWHAFYLLPWLSGQRPRAASAHLFPAAPREEEATILADLDGLPAVIHLTWRAAERGHWGLFRGERGTIEVGDDRLSVRLDGEEASFLFPEPLSRGSAHPDWFRDFLPSFLAAVREPASRAAALKEALDAARLAALCYGAPAKPRRRKAP